MAANKSMKLESHSPWPNLPDDVVSLIVNCLYYVDQIRFRAVCKSWRDAKIQILKSADKLPWNMAIDTVSGSCSLYDPSHKRKYAIKTSRIFVKATVLASKHGWVILADETDDNNAQIFFYNPLQYYTLDIVLNS